MIVCFLNDIKFEIVKVYGYTILSFYKYEINKWTYIQNSTVFSNNFEFDISNMMIGHLKKYKFIKILKESNYFYFPERISSKEKIIIQLNEIGRFHLL